MENKKGCGYCDNIVIHSFPDSPYIVKASVNFRKGKKIVGNFVMCDVDGVLSYMARQPFCDGIPYRVITHRGW